GAGGGVGVGLRLCGGTGDRGGAGCVVGGAFDGGAGDLDPAADDGQADEHQQRWGEDRGLDGGRPAVAVPSAQPPADHGLVTRSTVPWAVALTENRLQKPGMTDRQWPVTVTW